MNIKNKIDTNKLIITKADKRKMLVILTQEEYKHKLHNILQENYLIKMNKNPPQQYQKIVKQTLKQCNDIIKK
jgi:predicted house-cleaning noncanonical NTP pyrophosphatase (MazG superfamily)